MLMALRRILLSVQQFLGNSMIPEEILNEPSEVDPDLKQAAKEAMKEL
ncbi:MAG: hypothetical protein HY717_19710 [Planctomycetes bacterium]|nr:hypothetical protein [Planctomycetota bacterium]